MALIYKHIQARAEAGESAADIATAITAEGRTAKNINLADLLYLLNFRDMLTKEVGNDSSKKWAGSILTMKTAVEAAGDEAAGKAISQWLSHITNTRNTNWQTTAAEYASPFYQLYKVFADPAAGIFEPGDLDAIYALGGGRIEATTAEVQALIDAHEAVEAQGKIDDRITNAKALAGERINPTDTAPEQAAKWAKAWEDAV